MKVELNTDRHGFCIIGEFVFTVDQPEYNIDVDKLSEEVKKQLVYNVNRQVLKSDTPFSLKKEIPKKEEIKLVPEVNHFQKFDNENR